MKLSDFHYHLPPELIAKYPLQNRSQSRLLIVRSPLENAYFHQLDNFLKPGDLLIFNNSRVIPARLFAKKTTGGRVEILIERLLNETDALVHLGSNKKLKLPCTLILEDDSLVMVHARVRETIFRISFAPDIPALERLEKIGHIPLPPYIDREDQASDRERYQTVYNKIPGSAAAPTAGLHFDRALLARLQEKNIHTAELTLHVGAGTFMPVRTENILHHQMHSEYMTLTQETCDAIIRTKKNGGRIVAVGTTALRSLETAALLAAQNKLPEIINAYQGETNIFIYPGFQFRCVDVLITNFHLPESTLLMLVSAFAGHETIMKAYEYAISQHYRFYSYGDAMLIERNNECLPKS